MHGRFHAGNDDFPVNGEGRQHAAGLFRSSFRLLDIRIHAQMLQRLPGVGAQGISREIPVVKELNGSHGGGASGMLPLGEAASSNK